MVSDEIARYFYSDALSYYCAMTLGGNTGKTDTEVSLKANHLPVIVVYLFCVKKWIIECAVFIKVVIKWKQILKILRARSWRKMNASLSACVMCWDMELWRKDSRCMKEVILLSLEIQSTGLSVGENIPKGQKNICLRSMAI